MSIQQDPPEDTANTADAMGGTTNPFGDPITRERLTEIENSFPGGFWNATPQLQKIAAKAAELEISPWGLLLVEQQHRLTHIPPNVVLVKKDGKPGNSLFTAGSLNSFGALVSPPGGGKSLTYGLATELLPPDGLPQPDGTGQGIVRSFAETRIVRKDEEGKTLPKPERITAFHRHSMMVHAPEIKSLNAEFLREGSKTDTLMRSLWAGETVGMLNADTDRRVSIPPNMVRLCASWGVQPINAGAILAQAPDGTPQRFVWAPAGENRAPYPSRRPAPQGVTFPMPVFTTPPNTAFGSTDMPFEIPESKAREMLPTPIWVEWSPLMHVEIPQMRAEEAALADREPYATSPPERVAAEAAILMRGHLIFTTIKQTAAMGFIHGRPNPSDLDWELAKIQMLVSKGELAGVWKRCEELRFHTAEARGVDRAHEQRATSNTHFQLNQAVRTKVRLKLIAELDRRGPGGFTEGEANRFFKKKEEQDLVLSVLGELEEEGRLTAVVGTRATRYVSGEKAA